MSRLNWLVLILKRYYRHLGLRVSLYALLSLAAAVLSPLAQQFLPPAASARLGTDAIMPVLSILATSMLAVSTFSLNIMVSAYRAAAASTTPRVHRILLEDTTTQSVLATFIGAFVYALASIILYQANVYEEGSVMIVMGVTVLVVALVVLAMLHWIQHLTTLGSVDDSLNTVAMRAAEALDGLAKSPLFGAHPITPETVAASDYTAVPAPCSGYIQLLDVPHLQKCLPEFCNIYILHRPGAYVLEGQPIAQVTGQIDAEALSKTVSTLQAGFTIGTLRTIEQDAPYGLIVLSEIASKALSPGINDCGTAVATLDRMQALLWSYAKACTDTPTVTAPQVFVPELDHHALMDAAFASIARDGAEHVEIAVHIRRALAVLALSEQPELARAAPIVASRALDYALQGLPLDADRDTVKEISV